MARLEHPHIIPLYDYWYDQHNVYLVMRLVRGGSLRDAILSQDRLDMAAAADMLDQVAGALAVAHSVGIVHRDIKPDNILLDERGNAYLTDFGLAKNVLSGVAEADESSQELQELLEAQDEFFADSPHSTLYFTDMDAITGTPAYLSPEHIQAGNLSPQSDIYSLGITLYEALTGWQPFQGSLVSIIEQQLEEPLPSIHQQFPHIPPMVDAVLQRATAKTPEERYADATAMAVDFRRACGLG